MATPAPNGFDIGTIFITFVSSCKYCLTSLPGSKFSNRSVNQTLPLGTSSSSHSATLCSLRSSYTRMNAPVVVSIVVISPAFQTHECGSIARAFNARGGIPYDFMR